MGIVVLKQNEFRCEMCGGIFGKGWSLEEQAEEFKINFGIEVREEDAEICDDCYKKIIPLIQN